ncbi:MAG: HEAT repeat domain-containing protein [Acidobacteria bacterium]|nr:HEAT repeat domain-containing protein [Acidobacteriota bacterium]
MMPIETVVAAALALTGLLSSSPARAVPQERSARVDALEWQAREAARDAARRDREERMYEEGQEALEEGRWQRAVERFTVVAQEKSTRSDAAMYWRAYALDRLGQKAEALAAASELVKAYPASKWINDAKALALQVRQSSGQAVRPEAEADEELKLLALQGLQHSDPEQAVPMLEKILSGAQSPRLKERALFVLAQSHSPRARQVLANAAKGGTNPDLQRKAIQYLGIHGGRENRDLLAQVYEASPDVDIKRRILRAFAVSGDRARVLAAASAEGSAELRAEAVQQLGVMGAHDELWQLYQKEQTADVKKRIIQAMFVGGNATRLVELANSEPNIELRRAAIRNLGLMGSSKTGDALTALYTNEKDLETRKTIVQGFFHQNNAEQLVAIARKETDPQMRKELVSRLSLMRSKVALDYLMEILNK